MLGATAPNILDAIVPRIKLKGATADIRRGSFQALKPSEGGMSF